MVTTLVSPRSNTIGRFMENSNSGYNDPEGPFVSLRKPIEARLMTFEYLP